ncbi:MAG: hypothetical protein ACU837_08545 [Gammaproteobacteria bacterium]
MRFLLVGFLFPLISGCVSGHTVLANEEGNEFRCDKIIRFGMLGTIRANKEYNECIEEAQKKGYSIKSQE